MDIEGYCYQCQNLWDAHWSATGITPHRGMECPKCKGTRTVYTTDKDDDWKRETYDEHHARESDESL